MGEHVQLASPTVLMSHLVSEALDELIIEDERELEDALTDHKRNAERHAFLLRLGVWEVPPIVAYESRKPREGNNFPWDGPTAIRQRCVIDKSGGWTFDLEGWSGQQHKNVYLAEDYRFAWSLEDLAQRDAKSLMISLQFGEKLYSHRLSAQVFCPGCSDSGGRHTTYRYSTASDEYPSSLALQFGHDHWVICTLDGIKIDSPIAPTSSWWHPNPPTGAGLRQSPYRLLKLCGPSSGMTEELRQLAQISSPKEAGLEKLSELLLDLRKRYERRELVVDPVTSGSARQTFVSLHRLIYERLAELETDHADEVKALLAETRILCELGNGLVYRLPTDAFHNDGSFATFVRYFIGEIPFVTLPRVHDLIATHLGVQTFEVQLSRRSENQGRDVTNELQTVLNDRIPELLSIVVYHSLGTQTLEVDSQQFGERARRLQALTFCQMDDLVINASIKGSSLQVTIGEGADQNLFLEHPTSKAPILFHDLNGDGWQDHLCRKIAPYLAAIIENPAYTATFALFLQLETNAEREEYLLELGITSEAVDAIAARLGVVDEDERQRHLRWFTAIMQSMGGKLLNDDIEQTALISSLLDAGLSGPDAHRIVYAGGGEDVRSDTTDESSLRLLSEANVNLKDLHGHLLQLGDPGLSILDSKRVLHRWLNLHARRCAVVLAATQPHEIAKASVLTFSPPTNLEMSLDPPLDQILEPIAARFRDEGVDLTASALAEDAAAQLANAGRFESIEALDAMVPLLYDEEEQLRVLREHAALWRRELRLLAVLARTGAIMTRATIRTIDKTVNDTLPVNPSRPSDLMDALADLFIDHQGLVNDIENCMNDLFTSIVIERKEILRLAVKNGVRIDHLTAVKRALEAPRRDHARDIKRRKEYLIKCNLTPSAPSSLELQPHKPVTRSNGPKKVAAIKVSESHDRRKRELGDEGERWAFAAIVRSFLDFKIEMRIKAIEQVIILFDDFEGTPVKAALSHAELARSRDLDDDELIDELTGLLNVSSHSDAFGFDLIGWFPPTEGAELQAMCLEVKSSNGERFHLSSGEWGLAKRFHDAGKGNSYAVLVVRRAKRGGVPAGMDLLVDPVALVEAKQLRLEIDGYMTSYLYQEKKIQGAPLEKDNRQ